MGAKKHEPQKFDRFLSLDEAVEFLGGSIARKTLEDKARAGVVASYKPGKSRIFDPNDLREFAQRFKTRAR
jgi:hypothetical protein